MSSRPGTSGNKSTPVSAARRRLLDQSWDSTLRAGNDAPGVQMGDGVKAHRHHAADRLMSPDISQPVE